MAILDRWRKQPPPKPDRRDFSAAGRAHTQGFLELEEVNLDLQGNAGLAIFDKMYRTDGDIRQVVQMVCNPMISGTWNVVPYGGQEATPEAVKQADFVRWALFEHMSPSWEAHISQMLPMLVRSGFAPYEELWTTCEYDGKTYLVPRKLDLRLPRTIERFFQDRYGDMYSIVQQLPIPFEQLVARGYSPTVREQRTSANGETLHPGQVEILARDMVYYRLGAEGDNWEGVSFLRPAYKHWYIKEAIEKIDAIAQEREAVGIPICYPPLGATPRQLEEMEKVLAAMRTNDQGYIIAPGPKAAQGAPDGQGWLVEVIGYDRNGSGRDPMPSLEYHSAKIMAAFIAEFMRLGHGQSGARATAEVQADPFLMSVEALSHVIEASIQPLVDKIVAYNHPDAEHPPKLQMSLVDSTSLSQLADYVMKLTQIGALLPDQELEDFLRARADLPPANPESVKKRGKKDDDIRREVVVGGGPNGDAPGDNGKAGKQQAGKTKPKTTTKKLDDLDGRLRYRDLRNYEQRMDLDGIEDYMDDLPDAYAMACQGLIMSHAKGADQSKQIAGQIAKLMEEGYNRGYSDVNTELEAVNYRVLGRSVRDDGLEGLAQRCDHAVKFITASMELGATSARMNHDDDAEVQLAAETAGLGSLRRVAMGHGQGAYLQGRHDAISLAADRIPELRMIYTAILDSNTCESCALSDDGVPRAIDDPVRLDRRPPNRHCHSTLSGHNMCRCMEVAVIVHPDGSVE